MEGDGAAVVRSGRGRLVAVGASVVLHAALIGAWLLRRPEPMPRPAATIDVVLVAPRRTHPPMVDVEAASPAVTEETAPAFRTIPQDTSSPTPAAGPQAAILPSSGVPSVVAPSASDLSGLGRALVARAGCRELQRFSEAERARCTEFVMAAPERRLRETNPYIRVGEHASVMAQVRRAENTAERMSCQRTRNFDPTCPNMLPENLARDFEVPRD